MKKKNVSKTIASISAISMIAVNALNPIMSYAEVKDVVEVGGVETTESNFSGSTQNIYTEGSANITVNGNVDAVLNSGIVSTDVTHINPSTNRPEVDKKADANITVSGNVNVSGCDGDDVLTGIDAKTKNGDININVSGSVNVSGNDVEDTTSTGVYTSGSTNVTVGSVNVSGDTSTGVGMYGGSDTKNANTTVKGDVISTGKADSNGVDVYYVGDASSNVIIGGNVTATATDAEFGTATGIYISGDPDDITSRNNNVTVVGNVTANAANLALGIFTAGTNGNVNITVGGDVKGLNNGVVVNDNAGKVSIVTTGTISGKDSAIFVTGSKNNLVTKVDDTGTSESYSYKDYYNAPDITVWKIESDSNNLVDAEVAEWTYTPDEHNKPIGSSSPYSKDQSMITNILQSINYIIKGSVTENGQDTSNGKIVLKGTSGSVNVNGKTYETAHQGETITINVETVSGYKYSLKGNDGILNANADGTYTLKVPAGGGIELQAVLEKIMATSNHNSSSGGRGHSSRGGSGSSKIIAVDASGNIVNVLNNTALPETEGSWQKDASGKWIFVNKLNASYKNTWIVSNGLWYYLDELGNPYTGWHMLNNIYYYFSATDVKNHPYGSMYFGSVTPDGYWVNTNGAYIA